MERGRGEEAEWGGQEKESEHRREIDLQCTNINTHFFRGATGQVVGENVPACAFPFLLQALGKIERIGPCRRLHFKNHRLPSRCSDPIHHHYHSLTPLPLSPYAAAAASQRQGLLLLSAGLNGWQETRRVETRGEAPAAPTTPQAAEQLTRLTHTSQPTARRSSHTALYYMRFER